MTNLLAYYIINFLLLSGTSWAKYTPGMLRQNKSVPLCFTKTNDDVELPNAGYY